MTEWIPCKERRPDNHYEVIVSIRETQNPDNTIVHDIKEFLKTHPISELLEVVADAVKDKEQNQ